jgi:dUTP pyrophosphatase
MNKPENFPKLKIKAASQEFVPQYASLGASGADLKAHLETPLILEPFQTALIPTGIFLEIPLGWEVQIRPRSGLALKHSITVLNTPGTIDSDYRGQIQVLLINLGNTPFVIEPKMRIAQMIISPVSRAFFESVYEIELTERGSGGFGHTGLH